MTLFQARWARFALLLGVCAALWLTSRPSFAGTLQIKDTQGLLAASDTATLHRESEALPFDVRIVTTGDHESKAELERYVHEQLTAPNMIVVGIDKVHRHTAVHFGTATGVPASAFRTVEQAGSASFREGQWAAGMSAILSEAREVARSAKGQEAPLRGALAPTSNAGASTAMWGLLVVLIVAGLIVFVGVTLARRARSGLLSAQQPPYPENGPYPSGGAGPMGYPPGGYPAGGYPPAGYGQGGGIGRNIAAAGLGGLVGYELGKMAGEHEEHRGVEHESAGMFGAGDSDERNPDAGGAGGGWDDSGSSGDSDWGGGDSGGGGGDGGDSGGGGDW